MWVIVSMLNYLLSNRIVLLNSLPFNSMMPFDCTQRVLSQPGYGSSIWRVLTRFSRCNTEALKCLPAWGVCLLPLPSPGSCDPLIPGSIMNNKRHTYTCTSVQSPAPPQSLAWSRAFYAAQAKQIAQLSPGCMSRIYHCCCKLLHVSMGYDAAKATDTVEQREVVTNGQVPGTKDSGEVAQQRWHLRSLWPGEVASGKSSWRRWHLRGALTVGFIGRPMFVLMGLLVWHNGEGNGTPLQYSCLETPMDGGAW